jgi:hypothetical protein
MPALSKQQQKLFGLALAVKRGDVPKSDVSDEIKDIVKKMSEKDIKDFADTDTKNLPLKKESKKKYKRDYKKEYEKYGKSEKSKKYRAELNKYNRDEGTYGNGDGKDASHKGGKIVGFEDESKNRARKESFEPKMESLINKIDEKWSDLQEANAVSGGKVHKFITGKNLTFKGKKYPNLYFEVLGINNISKIVTLRILSPKNLFGKELDVPFKTIRRGPFLKTDTSEFNEGWSDKYKRSIDCNNPKGFSQRAHCQGKLKEDSDLNKGYLLARDLISKARAKMRNMTDDEVAEFRKSIAYAFDLKHGL